jgi:hypothetical protein
MYVCMTFLLQVRSRRGGTGVVQYKYNMLHPTHNSIQFNSMPCHAMPCHAMPCHAMPCHAMPCHAMPCHAMPCHAKQYTLRAKNLRLHNQVQPAQRVSSSRTQKESDCWCADSSFSLNCRCIHMSVHVHCARNGPFH